MLAYKRRPSRYLFSVVQVERDNRPRHSFSNSKCVAKFGLNSWLRNVYRLADHHAPMQNEHQDHRVEFEDRTFCDKTKRDVLVRPALRDPVGHKGSDGQSGRNGCAFKVLGFASLVLGQYGYSHVEPSKAGQTAENEECEEDVIKRGPDTKSECSSGGSETEGDLVGIRVLATTWLWLLAGIIYQVR